MSDERPRVKDLMVGVAATMLRRADNIEKTVTSLVDKALVVTMCAELPEELAVRVWLQPNVFNLYA